MYFDPYMQKAMLLEDDDPRALLQATEPPAATGAPVSNPPAPLGGSTPQAQMSPYGPSMGRQEPFSYTPDAAMQKDANLMGMFSNINRVAGGAGLDNPFAVQIKQNQALALERYNKLNQHQKDDPFHAYETAKARGYFTLGENENEAQGLRRFTQEQFKDPTKSVYSEKMDSLSNFLPEEQAAGLINGLNEVRTGPGGISELINKATGEVIRTLSADEAGQIEGVVARGKQFGTDIQGKIEGYITDLDEIQLAREETADLQEFSQGWFDRLSQKDEDGNFMLDTGPIQGLMANIGLGGIEIGELAADDIQNRLASLQIVNLAPVTEGEMKAMGMLFATPNQLNEQNLGSIKSFMNKLRREQMKLARREGRAKSRLDANFDNLEEYDRQYLKSAYGDWRPLTADGVDY